VQKIKRHYAKYLKNDSGHIVLLTEEAAYDIVKSHVLEPRKRMYQTNLNDPIKCGIWMVWGWNETITKKKRGRQSKLNENRKVKS